MSWTCKYDINGYCERLHHTCEPTIPGCVLHGKYIRAMDMYPEDLNPPSTTIETPRRGVSTLKETKSKIMKGNNNANSR